MRIAEVVGTVTLNRQHPSLTGACWRIVVPLDHQGLKGEVKGRGEPFIVYDELGSGEGQLVAISEGAEAATPFYPQTKAIDGYVAAILDSVEVE